MTPRMNAAKPSPHELHRQANGDRAEYLRLMEQHGHLVPRHGAARLERAEGEVERLREALAAIHGTALGGLGVDERGALEQIVSLAALGNAR